MQFFVAVLAVVLSIVAAYDGDVLVKNTLGEFTDDFGRSEQVAYLHLRQELKLYRREKASRVTDTEYHDAVALVQGLATTEDKHAALEQVKAILNRMKQSELLQFMTEFNQSTTNTLLALSAQEGSANTTLLLEVPEEENYGYHASTIGACLLLATALVAIVLVVRVYQYENDAAIIAHVLQAIHEKDIPAEKASEVVVV